MRETTAPAQLDDSPFDVLSRASVEVARLVRARARVWTETMCVDRGAGLRAELQEVSAPVLALEFEYEGFVVRASDPSDRVLCAGAAGEGGTCAWLRDRGAEQRARLTLESFGAIELELLEDHAPPPGCEADYAVMPEQNEQAQCGFVAHALPQLRALGWVIELHADYPYRVVPDAPWYAVVEPEGERADWFSLELGVEIDGHRVDLLPVLLELLDDSSKCLDLVRIGHTGPRYVPLPGQRGYVEVPAEQFRTLARVLAELYQGEGDDGAFPAVRAAVLEELDVALGRPVVRAQGVLDSPRSRATPAPDAPVPTAEEVLHGKGLVAELRPYQARGLLWLQQLKASGVGGVLADDMGLGKTLQTIAHLCAEHAEHGGQRAERPSLVIAPTSLTGNWRRELEKFAPGLRVLALHGPDRARRRSEIPGADVAITSYPVLLRDEAVLCAERWHCVVLDEAQAIKNPRSRASQLVRALECEQRIALSGTPVENHLHELWSLIDFAVPGLLGSEEQFRSFYRIPIEQQEDETRLSALRSVVAPYVLRRMKEQVATELPPKTEIVRPVELRGKQRELYESIRVAVHEKVRAVMRKRGPQGSAVTVLAALTKLRQLCCDPRLVHGEPARFVRESAKYELLMQLLDEHLPAGRRVLIFSQFTTMLGLISRGLHERGIAHTALTGATVDRDRAVRRFQGGDVDVFLISLKAGGTGLTLTRADTVIHYDPWWNPAAQDQATDRAHRIGQDKPVFVHRLIVAGSVEERMLALQQRKRRLASAVVSPSAPVSSSLFGEAEVEHLLAPLDD